MDRTSGGALVKVAFVSNFLNHHQLPFCEAMIGLEEVADFRFVATAPFNADFLKTGYRDMNAGFDWVVRAYEGEAQKELALKLVDEADVALVLPECTEYSDVRRRNGKITFLTSERILKRGLWWRYAPPKMLRTHRRYLCYRNADFHVLCASAFASLDMSLSGFPADRCFKWGYFTAVPEGLPHLRAGRGIPSILWAGRLIEWKRPMWALQLAKRLRDEGREFSLRMVGEGPCRQELEAYVRDERLGGCVELVGGVPNERMLEEMAAADVFLFTSTREEGWGAVLSEAMSRGCAVVAASQIGSVPFLVEDGVNGLVFDGGSEESLHGCAARLLEDGALRARLGSAARATMLGQWNPECAAKRLLGLVGGLASGGGSPYADGPCSPAEIIPDNWHGRVRSRWLVG